MSWNLPLDRWETGALLGEFRRANAAIPRLETRVRVIVVAGSEVQGEVEEIDKSVRLFAERSRLLHAELARRVARGDAAAREGLHDWFSGR